MNCLFVSLCLLDILYHRSPLADCQALDTEIVIGQWETANETLGDHRIIQSHAVYAIDMWHLIVKNFVYDGACPFAEFRVENTLDGTDSTNTGHRLGKYTGIKDIHLKVPIPPPSFNYLTVWCRTEMRVYAYVTVPEGVRPPRTTELGLFLETRSGVEGRVTIPDGATFRVGRFYYDGTASNATFTVGNTDKPDASGTVLPVELNGRRHYGPLPKFENVVKILKLPYGKTVCDYKWLAVYGHKTRVPLGHVMIPADIRLPRDYGQNDIDWPTPTFPPVTNPMSSTEQTTTNPGITGGTTGGTTGSNAKQPGPRTTTAQPEPETTRGNTGGDAGGTTGGTAGGVIEGTTGSSTEHPGPKTRVTRYTLFIVFILFFGS